MGDSWALEVKCDMLKRRRRRKSQDTTELINISLKRRCRALLLFFLSARIDRFGEEMKPNNSKRGTFNVLTLNDDQIEVLWPSFFPPPALLTGGGPPAYSKSMGWSCDTQHRSLFFFSLLPLSLYLLFLWSCILKRCICERSISHKNKHVGFLFRHEGYANNWSGFRLLCQRKPLPFWEKSFNV